MRNIWLYSDPHLLHKHILTFKNSKGDLMRPFSNVDEMNEFILEKHNSVVKDGDIVYCLGDVFFGDKDEFSKLWNRFNGSKRLIVGNHDDVKFLAKGNFFKKINMWRMFTEFGLLLTHVPVNYLSIPFKDGIQFKNIHGHTHDKSSPEGNYQSVCLEVIDYTPVNIEEVRIQ